METVIIGARVNLNANLKKIYVKVAKVKVGVLRKAAVVQTKNSLGKKKKAENGEVGKRYHKSIYRYEIIF